MDKKDLKSAENEEVESVDVGNSEIEENQEIDSVDVADAISEGNEQIDTVDAESVDNEEVQSIDNMEIELVENEIDSEQAVIAKKKKPVNKKKRTLAIVISAISVVFIAALAFAAWYFLTGTYVATVGGQKISTDEFKYYLKQSILSEEQNASQQGQTLTDDASKKKFWDSKDQQSGKTYGQLVKEKTVNTVWQIQVLYNASIAKDSKAYDTQLPLTKAEIEKQYKDAKKTEKQFVDELKKNYNVNYETYIKYFAKLDVAKKFYNDSQSAIAVSDEEIQKYYDSNKDKMDALTVKYSMYLTSDPSNGQPLSDEKIKIAKDKAEAAIARAKKGEDFDKIIADESEDPNKEKGKGEAQFSLDEANSQGYNADISEALRAMKIDEYKLIELKDTGFIVIKYIKRTTLVDTKEQVKSTIQGEQFQKTFQELQDKNPIVENRNGAVINGIDIIKV